MRCLSCDRPMQGVWAHSIRVYKYGCPHRDCLVTAVLSSAEWLIVSQSAEEVRDAQEPW